MLFHPIVICIADLELMTVKFFVYLSSSYRAGLCIHADSMMTFILVEGEGVIMVDCWIMTDVSHTFENRVAPLYTGTRDIASG